MTNNEVYKDIIMHYTKSVLEQMIGSNEEILWRGKPNKLCYILESIFNPFLPFALLWLLFDLVFITSIIIGITKNPTDATSYIPLIFILIHLMPVWIYLAGVLLARRKYQNTSYIITDKAVYVSGGILGQECEMKTYAQITDIKVRRGIFDQQIGVGDILLEAGTCTTSKGKIRSYYITISDIPDFREVFNLIKEQTTEMNSVQTQDY